MAWPKGRRRTKPPQPVRDIGPEPVSILRHPAQPEATSSAPPPPVEGMKAARRKIMLHRLRGNQSTLDWSEWRQIRHLEDMRDQKLVWHIQAAMTKAGASMDEAEAYLDAELAARD